MFVRLKAVRSTSLAISFSHLRELPAPGPRSQLLPSHFSATALKIKYRHKSRETSGVSINPPAPAPPAACNRLPSRARPRIVISRGIRCPSTPARRTGTPSWPGTTTHVSRTSSACGEASLSMQRSYSREHHPTYNEPTTTRVCVFRMTGASIDPALSTHQLSPSRRAGDHLGRARGWLGAGVA